MGSETFAKVIYGLVETVRAVRLQSPEAAEHLLRRVFVRPGDETVMYAPGDETPPGGEILDDLIGRDEP